jgi:transposase InsO family protein
MPRKRRQKGSGGRDKGGGSGTVIRYRSRSVHPLEFRVRLVREVLEKKTSSGEVGRIFGVNKGTLYEWVKRYEAGGLEGLAPARVGAKPKKKSVAATAKREAVAKLRQEHPEYGTRRISDMLRRFAALGVSETVVRRILHEEGLLLERASQEPARAHPPRRFERAAPNQLWQSDIFTFLLRRHERLYLAAFMDDHSRFIVSYALAHRQKSELVMEALERGIAEYGTPQEWTQRPPIGRELRDSFRAEVYDRATRIERHMDHDNDLAMRLAIEQALTQRGYLRLERGVGAN